MLSIIAGLVGIVIGVVMIWKPQKFVEMIGEPDWSEKVFGYNHGSTAYQAIGIIIIIVSFMLMFGIVETIIKGIFPPLIT